jgi:hypothetical protein
VSGVLPHERMLPEGLLSFWFLPSFLSRFAGREAPGPAGFQLFRGSHFNRRIGVDLVFHAIAFAFDDDSLGVVKDAIEQCGGERGVVVKDLSPVFEGTIGISYLELNSCYGRPAFLLA